MKASSYRLNARAVVQRRDPVPTRLPEGCVLALLTAAPDPEGTGLQEIGAYEYRRQVVAMANASEGGANKTFRNANWVVFGPALAWPTATHAAVLDDNGDVLAYGWLETAPGHTRAEELTFAPGSIQVRFS